MKNKRKAILLVGALLCLNLNIFSLRRVRRRKWKSFIRHWKDCMKRVPTIRATGISVGIILLRVE